MSGAVKRCPERGPSPGGAGEWSGPATTERLGRSLERLFRRRGGHAGIAGIERAAARYRSSWWLEHLRVTLRDGTVVEIVFKDLGLSAPGCTATRAKPLRIVDLEREPWMYRTVLGPTCSGPPTCLGSVSWPEAGRHWLFLERVAGVPLAEVGDPGSWEEAAAWLARFHATVGRHTLPDGPLIRHDARLHRWWFQRALERAGAVEAVQRVEAAHAAAIEEVAGLPRTLVHGEFYPANVLVEDGRIRPVDWEMAGVGPGLLDVAALTSGGWSTEARTRMALAYRSALLDAGGRVPPPQGLLRALTACRLLIAVQWLGWGRGWTPPPEHQQDWLGEAVQCAEAMGGTS